ncbi:MAG: cobalt ECF transporter T component CbiQ [Geminicoccaceae bacterium]
MTLLTALERTAGDGAGHSLRRIDPRIRVVAAVAFAVVTVALHEPWPLVAALAVATALAMAAALPVRATLRRMLVLDVIVLPLLAILPFTVPGAVAFAVGGTAASWEGIGRAIEVLLTTNAVVLALIALVGTIEPSLLGHALAGLRLPPKLVQLFLLTTRYVAVLHEEHERLRQAMRARAFRPRGNRHTWTSYGWLFGMLLVRSFERAERILEAMRCRGFDGRVHRLAPAPADRGSLAFGIGFGLLLALLLVADRIA